MTLSLYERLTLKALLRTDGIGNKFCAWMCTHSQLTLICVLAGALSDLRKKEEGIWSEERLNQ
jgi:hypothetical protein